MDRAARSSRQDIKSQRIDDGPALRLGPPGATPRRRAFAELIPGDEDRHREESETRELPAYVEPTNHEETESIDNPALEDRITDEFEETAPERDLDAPSTPRDRQPTQTISSGLWQEHMRPATMAAEPTQALPPQRGPQPFPGISEIPDDESEEIPATQLGSHHPVKIPAELMHPVSLPIRSEPPVAQPPVAKPTPARASRPRKFELQAQPEVKTSSPPSSTTAPSSTRRRYWIAGTALAVGALFMGAALETRWGQSWLSFTSPSSTETSTKKNAAATPADIGNPPDMKLAAAVPDSPSNDPTGADDRSTETRTHESTDSISRERASATTKSNGKSERQPLTNSAPQKDKIDKPETERLHPPTRDFPKNVPALMTEAKQALKSREFRRAEQLTEHALDLEPRNADLIEFAVRVYMANRRHESVLETARDCIGIDPQRSFCWATIADRQSNRPEARAEAIRAWQRYVELEPSGEHAARARLQLERLQGRAPTKAPSRR